MSLISWLGGAVRNVEHAVGGAVNGAEQAVNNNVIHPAQQAVQQAVQHPQQAIQQAVRPVAQAINPMLPAAFDAGKFVINHAPQIGHGLQQVPGIAGNMAKQAISPVVNTIASPIEMGIGLATHNPAAVIDAQRRNPIAQAGTSFGLAAKDVQNHQNPTANLLKGAGTTGNLIASGLPLVGFGRKEGAKLGAQVVSSALKNSGLMGAIGASQGAMTGKPSEVLKQGAIGTGLGAGFGAGGELAGKALQKVVTSPLVKNEQGGARLGGDPNSKVSLGQQIINHYKGPTPANDPALRHVAGDPHTAMANYDTRVQDKFGTTKVASGDEAKYIIPGFDATKSGDYHEAASALAKTKYDQLLANPATKNQPVMIMAGGSGAGKTSALKNALGDSIHNYAAVVDTNSNKLASADTKIQQALASGRPAHVTFVHSDPAEAFNRVMSRAKEEGRIVPVAAHADTHVGSREVIDQLAQKYASNPNVVVNAIDNSGPHGSASLVPLDKMPQMSYTRDELANKVKGVLHEAHQNNQISDAELHTYLGSQGAQPQNAIRNGSGAQSLGLPEAQGVKPPQQAPNKFTESVKNSPEVAPSVKPLVSGEHVVRNTADLAKRAEEFASQGDTRAALDHIHQALAVPDGQITDETAARAIKVANKAAYEGHTTGNEGLSHEAASIYDSLSNHALKQGQGVQALSLLARETPEGKLYRAQGFLKKAGVELKPEEHKQLIGLVDKLRSTEEGSQARFEGDQKLAHFVNSRLPSGKLDKLFTLWRTGLLTGPQTVTKVALSHGVQNTLENASHPTAAALDTGISAIRKMMGKDGFRTTGLSYKGQVKGAVQGTKAATKLLIHNIDTKDTGALGGLRTELGRPQVNYDQGVTKGPVGKFLNQYVEKVTNVHAALPKAYNRAAFQGDLQRQARAAAINQGVKGSERSAFIKNFVNNPSEAAHNEATHAAQMASFQQETKLGKVASKLQAVPGGRVLSPFAHIASAILTDAANYSPAGAVKTVIEALRDNKAGGWTPEVQKHFVEGLGRSITGTGILAAGTALYNSGLLTLDYPKDPKTAALWKAEGKQPGSILLGGKWRQLASLGPAAITLAMGGYAGEAQKTGQKGNEALTAMAGALKTLSNESFLSGVTGAAGAIDNPQQNAKSFLKNEASSIIPTIVGTIARATDPLQRQTNTPIQAIESKLPGLREALLPAQDALGNTLQRAGGVVTNLLDPTRPTNAVNTPVINELDRLSNTGNTVAPQVVKTIGGGANAVHLTPQQSFDRTAAVGPQINAAYKAVMSSPGYGQLSDTNKAAALSSAASDLNQVANVKALVSANSPQAQKAYNGLSSNQKAMFNGQPSIKDYTALDSNGKSLTGSKVDPKTAYQQAVQKFNQQKAAGLLTPIEVFKTQEALGKQAITSNYSSDVQTLYGMSKAERNAAYASNPDLAKLAPQVAQLSADLNNKNFTATDKVAKEGATAAKKARTATKTAGNKIASASLKMNKTVKGVSFKTPKVGKVKTVKLAHIPKMKLPKAGAVKSTPGMNIAVSPVPRKSKTGSLLA